MDGAGDPDVAPVISALLIRAAWPVAAASTVAVCAWWVARHRDARPWAAAAAIAVALSTAWAVRGPPIPTEWVTVLHEGTTATNVAQLYGRGVHAGPAFEALVTAWCGPDGIRLPGIVRLNVWLTCVGAAVFWVVSGRILGSAAGATALTAVLVANPSGAGAALSELPSPAISACILAAIPALALLEEHRGRPGVSALLLAHVGLLALLVAFMRAELAILGALALGTATLRVLVGDERLRGLARGALAAIARRLAGADPRLLLAALAVGAASHLWSPPGNEARWVFDGLHPLNPSILTLPIVLSFFLPLGVVALILLGLAHACRDLLRFALAPIAIVVLYRTWLSAGHGSKAAYHEVFRYLTAAVPLLLLVAAFGWRELCGIAARRGWPGAWRPLALLALALAMAAPHPPGTFGPILPNREDPNAPPPPAPQLVTRDAQLEVRYLLRLVSEHPDCAFLTPVRVDGGGSPRAPGERTLLAFGRPLRSARTLGPARDGGLSHLPLPPCVVFYRGLECNLAGGDGCPAPEGPAAAPALTFTPRPYSEVVEWGEAAPLVRLDAVQIRR